MLREKLKSVQYINEMSMKQIYIVGFCLLASITSWGQTQKAFISAGEEAFASENYYGALIYYLEAIEFDTASIDLHYRAGQAARNFQSYSKAEELYTYVVKNDSDVKYPSATFHLAHMQQMQAKYVEAKTNYELYLSEHEDDNARFTARTRKELSSIEWASDKVNNPEPSVTVNNLGPNINSQYSEIAGIIDGEQIVYTSVRYFPKNRKKYTDKHIGKVLSSVENSIPVEITETFNEQNLHTSHVTYNMNRSKVFYTVCSYINDGDDIRCDIYCRPVLGDGNFGDSTKLSINIDTVTNTQPNIGFDKTSGQEILYFVSDREGGKGGLDIWASNITGIESFANPVNLSAVNTTGDDITPFFHNNSQVLYFSTDGDMSLGGFDVFRSVKTASGFQRAQNLLAPTNSSYNDVFYTLSKEGENGLLSSNRPGSLYIDENHKSCCYDIYKVDVNELEITLNALTFDAKSLDSLEGVTVQLVDAGTGTELNVITNDLANDHIFKVDRNKSYLLVSSRPGYHTDTLPVNTNTVFQSGEIIRKIYLKRSTLELAVFTFDDISREPLPGTTVRLEDLTDNSIQEILVTNESGNDFKFDVIPNHSYRVSASRDRYYDDSVEFIAIDNDGSGTITKNLYLIRRDLNIYLPLALYFDNDIPERRSNALTTNLIYSQTFDDFVIQKFEFKEEYSRNLVGAEKALAESRVESFFEDDVKGGYDRFLRFLDYIYGQLKDGNSFDLSIRGFASPRADTKYNLSLSQRRVVSIYNELNDYQDGVLKEFIANGQLKITELSYGESLAPDNVSDALYDRQNSIYSPEASKERRGEIVEIKQGSSF